MRCRNCGCETTGVNFQAEGLLGKQWANSGLCNSCWREECSCNGVPPGGDSEYNVQSAYDSKSTNKEKSFGAFASTRSTQTRSHSPSSGFPVIQFIAIALLGFLFVVMNDRSQPTTLPTTHQVEVGQ